MIAQLSELSQAAQPTAFHQLLRVLDDRGRLLRVYTQNIDALELKSGLTFGVPEMDSRRSKSRSPKGKSDCQATSVPSTSAVPMGRLPSPPAETPRCIPLHGTLQNMHCQICLHSFPLENYLDDLNAGTFPVCPECSQMEEARQAVGKRSRGIGKLRPSVVLYNELHKDGEEVGEVVERDLIGNSKGKGRAGADLLIVVGTSLRVPGTKRMVREFSKAVHLRSSASQPEPTSSSTSYPTPSPRRSPVVEEDPPVKTIYLNLDFPVPTRDWEGIFDVWIRGDAQSFAEMVQAEIEREERVKEEASERKKRREEQRAEAARAEEERLKAEARAKTKFKSKSKVKSKVLGKPTALVHKKRKEVPGTITEPRPIKKRKVSVQVPMPASIRGRKTTKKTRDTPASQPTQARLTIKLPARSTQKAVSQATSYTPLTPPPSQRSSRLVPEVVIETSVRSRAPCVSAKLATPLSPPPSPLTSAPSSPQRPPAPLYSTFIVPNSSPLSSPPTSPLSSPPLSHMSSPLRHAPSPSMFRKRLPQMLPKRSVDISYGNRDCDTEDFIDIENEDVDSVSNPRSPFPTSYERTQGRALRPRAVTLQH
ncbi:hypothetical protein PHLCEN_2v4963 [Hermanssonia centrifuga]|uniref:Deacetylase sirtuin-type domain-containing protein n=1 Tax=Hermanssonia centrifuga TaxID=98765 RepID=A0A2R6PCC5_9APHY|nr:hypothetical protein PHLCEN_2v4963 [Hermanssonia centrifuga]